MAYAAVLALPLIVRAVVFRPAPGMETSFSEQLADQFGLLGFTILALQFPLAARIPWIEWPFGLDIVVRFHRAMAVFATLLLLAHPLLMAAGGEPELLTRWDAKWPIQVGRAALLVLLATVVLSLGWRAMRLSYETWQRWHRLFAGSLLALGVVHSSVVAEELATWPMRVVWGALVLTAAAAYAYHRIYHPRYADRGEFVVAEVVPESHDTWTVRLRPERTGGGAGGVAPYLPGQFHYLTLAHAGQPAEEHPFTIASSPTDGSHLASTIKASGDYTRTVPQIAPGTRARVRGPFGRFSHLLHPDAAELVFVAGGVGLTPFMSMLRYMRDANQWRPTVLFAGTRTERDLLFRDELATMVARARGLLTVVHVLSRPGDTWAGEQGHVTAATIARHVGPDRPGVHYFVCGPPALSATVLAELGQAGVPAGRLHTEQFAL